MSVVFAVHPVNNKSIDLKTAEQHGNIRYINARYVYGDEIGNDGSLPKDIAANIERCVMEFDIDHDYLLIAGDHLQVMVMSALLGARYPYFKILRYDREAEGYWPVRVNCSI